MMHVPIDPADGLDVTRKTSRSSKPFPTARRQTVLTAALSSGLCLDMMIEHMLDRADRGPS